jgi:hypothetical protein
LLLAHQTLALGLATDAVRLGLDHAGGVTLHTDPQRFAEIEALLVGQPEFPRKLIDADV